MSQVIPSLSLAGFINDLPSMVDRMLSYYLTSEYSQSNLFNGRVLSLQKQMQAYQHDDNLLRSSVREELTEYFAGICDIPSVEVTTEFPNPEDPSRINLTVSVVVTKDGKSYSVGKMIETKDSITLRLINLNNEGVTAL